MYKIAITSCIIFNWECILHEHQIFKWVLNIKFDVVTIYMINVMWCKCAEFEDYLDGKMLLGNLCDVFL